MAFVVLLNQTLTFRKSGEEGRQKFYPLGAAKYLAPALLFTLRRLQSFRYFSHINQCDKKKFPILKN
jgi:hypothetical protein